jgi:hypothetical protein
MRWCGVVSTTSITMGLGGTTRASGYTQTFYGWNKANVPAKKTEIDGHS